MKFFKAYSTKNIPKEKCAAQKHNAFHLDILRDSISIPGELLLSRARFRFLMSAIKLNLKMYIYNLS